MTKIEFLTSLRQRLSGLPQEEIHERLRFYSEMIEDRVEEGISEEEAVSAVGSVEEIAAQIIKETPSVHISKSKPCSRWHPNAWMVLLLILGSPLWLPLLIAVFSVAFSLYVTLWSVIISLWAVFGSVIACAICGVVVGVVFSLCGNRLVGIALTGSSLVCAGFSILLFYGCKAISKATVWLTKKTFAVIRKCFTRKENV